MCLVFETMRFRVHSKLGDIVVCDFINNKTALLTQGQIDKFNSERRKIELRALDEKHRLSLLDRLCSEMIRNKMHIAIVCNNGRVKW
jgi:hypothetical protein